MRRLLWSALVVSLAAGWAGADEVTSAFGRKGPALAAGVTPSKLGWGEDSKPYPDKFVVNPKDGAELVWVPAGEFSMGTSEDEQVAAFDKAREALGTEADKAWFEDEKPAHKIKLTKGFWLYRFEVTNGQYRKKVARHSSGKRGPADFNGDRQPVVKATWDDARSYCSWAGVSLPTEAQWEYACRAGTTGKWWFGDDEKEVGKYANVADKTGHKAFPEWQLAFDTDDGVAGTAPVGSYKPNPWGLNDMLGNAWEWVKDTYQADYYASSPDTDPSGPDKGDFKVIRGGSFWQHVFDVRAGNRSFKDPTRGYEYLGFRAAKVP